MKKIRKNIIMFLVLAMILQLAVPIGTNLAFGERGETVTDDVYGEKTPRDNVTVMQAVYGEEEFPFITNVEIVDDSGNTIGDEEISKDAYVNIKYYFDIPDDYTITAGQVYILSLPDEFEISSFITKDLSHNGEVMATIEVDTDNNMKITFTEYATTLSDINGHFFIETRFDEEEIGEGGETKIEFDLGTGRSQEITVNFEEEPVTLELGLSKLGDYDEAKNEITWTISVKPGSQPPGKPINNVVITDVIEAGQAYEAGSATIDPVVSGGKFNFDDDTKTLSYAFNSPINNVEGEEYTITFKTTPNIEEILEDVKDGDIISFKNEAVATYDGGDPVSDDYSIIYTTINYVEKEGEFIKDSDGDRANDRIRWTVTVNSNEFNIKDAKIVDTIPQWLEVDKNTIELSPDINGKNPIVTGNYTTGETLTYELGNISQSYTLTYETIIKDPNHYQGNSIITYTNKVEFTGDGVSGEDDKGVGVGLGTGLIDKSGSGYNRSKQEITWTITVNKNEIEIENAVVTDEIKIPDGQEFVNDSVTISPDIENAKITEPDKNGELKIELGTIDKKIVITFRTKVIDPSIWANNTTTSKFYNTAKLTGNNIDDSQDTGEQVVTSEVIKKEGIGYDYQTRIATWKITVNQNKMPMTNAVVTDVIEDGQEFVENSVTINPKIENAIGYENGILTISLGDINEEHTITFQTKIINPDDFFNTNGEKQLKNTAKLELDELPDGEVESTGTNPIDNTVVSKRGTYKNRTDFIEWEVIVNQNQLEINNATLQDTLQEGLLLDTASIELYELEVQPGGGYSQVRRIEVTGDHFDYDSETRLFVFRLGDIDSPYSLKFTTDIDNAYNNETFSNSINFTGSDIEQNGNSESIQISFSTLDGDITGRTGSITIIKVDENDDSIPLQGAIFELYDKFGKLIRVSEPTGEDGVAVFDKLKFANPYTLEEQKAPEGYEESEESHEFTLSRDKDESDITYRFKNSKIKIDIPVLKVWEGGQNNRPESIQLQLLRDGEPHRKPLILEDGVVESKWEDLDKTDHNGRDYVYTVVELEVPNYDSEVVKSDDGFVITNIYTSPTTDITAIKDWVDGPEEKPTVWFKLYRRIDNEPREAVNVEIQRLVDGEMEVTWTDLDVTDSDGNKYIYSVQEVDAQGKDFTPANYEKTENGLEVTNYYVSPTDASAKAVKEWVNGSVDRPTVWFELYRQIEGGELEAVPGVYIKELPSGTTEVLWNKLAKTDRFGNEYIYSVQEVDAQGNDFVPANYEKEEDGLKVTNTYVIPKTEVTGRKVWIGGSRTKPTIELQLYRDGIAFGDPVRLEDGETEYTWEELDETDEDGKEYVYTVDEIRVPNGYRKSISEDGLTVTNRYRSPGGPGPGPGPEDPEDPKKPEESEDPEEPEEDPEDPTDPEEPEEPTDPEDPEDPEIPEVPPYDLERPMTPEEYEYLYGEIPPEGIPNRPLTPEEYEEIYGEIPKGVPTVPALPKTGSAITWIYPVLGIALVGAGVGLKKKKEE